MIRYEAVEDQVLSSRYYDVNVLYYETKQRQNRIIHPCMANQEQ